MEAGVELDVFCAVGVVNPHEIVVFDEAFTLAGQEGGQNLAGTDAIPPHIAYHGSCPITEARGLHGRVVDVGIDLGISYAVDLALGVILWTKGETAFLVGELQGIMANLLLVHACGFVEDLLFFRR